MGRERQGQGTFGPPWDPQRLEAGALGAAPPQLLVIFGASGDVARRKLLPALYGLAKAHLLPKRFAVVGYGRTEWADGDFRGGRLLGVVRHLRARASASNHLHITTNPDDGLSFAFHAKQPGAGLVPRLVKLQYSDGDPSGRLTTGRTSAWCSTRWPATTPCSRARTRSSGRGTSWTPGHTGLAEDLQIRAGSKPVEVLVCVEDRNAVAHARGCDEAVECLADSHARTSCLTVQEGGEGEVVQALEPQDRKRAEVFLDTADFMFGTKALQDLGEHNIGES